MVELRKVMLVGASSGIGREMALWFAHRNWRVGVTGRREALLRDLADRFPDVVVPSAFDITEIGSLSGRLDELAARLGGMDALVVAAGTGDLNPGLEPGVELGTAAVNVDAFTACVIWGFNHFRKRGGGGGRLAAITSVGGLTGEAAAPAYPASKAYQIMYLNSLRKLAKREKLDCRITDIRPGSVDTAMMKGEGHFWISSPEEAAALACRAVVKGKRIQYISRRWSAIGTALRLASVFS